MAHAFDEFNFDLSLKDTVQAYLYPYVRKILYVCSAAVLAFLIFQAAGCTHTVLFDVDQGDVFSYNYAPWDNQDIEEAKARLQYWCSVGPKHYATNKTLRLEMNFWLDETNKIKKATYYFPCTAECESRETEP